MAQTIFVGLKQKQCKKPKTFLFLRRKSQRLSDNDEILLNNTVKYRKKLQTAITQINRTKKSKQRYFESSDSEIHGNRINRSIVSLSISFVRLVARLVNDIGQLSDSKSLQVLYFHIHSQVFRVFLGNQQFNRFISNAASIVISNIQW